MGALGITDGAVKHPHVQLTEGVACSPNTEAIRLLTGERVEHPEGGLHIGAKRFPPNIAQFLADLSCRGCRYPTRVNGNKVAFLPNEVSS